MGKTNWLFQLCWVIRWIKSWWRLIASIDWRNAPWWYWHQKWSFETTFHERTNQFEENGRLFQVYDTGDEMINNFYDFFSSSYNILISFYPVFLLLVVIKLTWADFCAALDKNFPCIHMTCWKIILIVKLCSA